MEAAVAPRMVAPTSTTTIMATTLLTSTSNTLGGRPGRTSLLEIRDHARLIDHHAAHISSTRNSTSASTYSSSSAPRAPAAGIWTSPPPSHSIPGGEVSSDWTNPDELEKSKTIAIKNGCANSHTCRPRSQLARAAWYTRLQTH